MVKSSSLHNPSKKLVSSVESSHPGILHPVKSFVLKSNNTFAGRASDVFNRLSSLENEHSIWMANNETHGSFEADDASTDNIADTTPKIDTFKKPFLPVRRNKTHGFIHKKKNSRVWRKYSLKDVPLTSDAKNAAVAFQFLNELRKKKEENNCNELASDDGKVVFRKPLKRNPVQSTSTSCNKTSSNSETAAEKLSNNISSSSSIKLDHLQDEFEDE